jgi:hypothetical protein
VHSTSIAGRSRGANSRTASIAGSDSSSTSTIVAAASASDSSSDGAKPSAVSNSPYADSDTPRAGV